MSSTKKVAAFGRFGSRYGVGIRKRVIKVETEQRKAHECPSCGAMRVKRSAKGIFVCAKCQHKFAGGSFVPRTLSGSIVQKAVSQKQFSLAQTELERLKEAASDVSAQVAEKPASEPKKPKKEKKPKSSEES
ncbi:MAG: 50S ribosomal protein L37ae [Candidatus Diapherotrites archaeon]|nr:50S ribosomal protein L37ae [Candidatus Diapherotrites archaeon]